MDTLSSNVMSPPHAKLDVISPAKRWHPFSLFQRDFAAKVRWHMKFDNNPKISLLQDKLYVKEYVSSLGIASAPLLFSTTKADEIPFDTLPDECFIKANNGSGWNILKREGRLFRYGNGQDLLDEDGQLLPQYYIGHLELSREGCIEVCFEWLTSQYSQQERSYHRIPPCILGEERLYPRKGSELFDYRLYTFNGNVVAINVGSPSYRRRSLNIFFDAEWNEIPLTKSKEARPQPVPSRPETLQTMIEAASILGRDFPFIRIDFYDTSKGAVFGECTFYPQGGAEGTPTICPRFNKWLGSHW